MNKKMDVEFSVTDSRFPHTFAIIFLSVWLLLWLFISIYGTNHPNLSLAHQLINYFFTGILLSVIISIPILRLSKNRKINRDLKIDLVLPAPARPLINRKTHMIQIFVLVFLAIYLGLTAYLVLFRTYTPFWAQILAPGFFVFVMVSLVGTFRKYRGWKALGPILSFHEEGLKLSEGPHVFLPPGRIYEPSTWLEMVMAATFRLF